MTLESVQFSGKRTSIGGNTLEIAQSSGISGSVTIICGRNHSGKSFILKRIHRCILKLNDDIEGNKVPINYSIQIDGVTCKFSRKINEPISVVMICDVSDITEMMKDVSPIKDSSLKRNIEKPLGKEEFVKTDQFVKITIKNCFEKFRVECFTVYKGFSQPLDYGLLNDEGNNEYRVKILNEIPTEKLFLTPRNNEIVKVFEKLTRGKLYYGVAKRRGKNLPTFQVYLVFNGDSIIPFSNWSDGQQVLFSILMMLFYERPSILLFDEIENHLHPEYISAAIEFAKLYTIQTIITTHHPHLIFSKHIDSVNFLEVLKSSEHEEPEEVIDYNRNIKSKTPIRGNILLNQGYSKLLSTYKLFDSYDTQLLKLSSLVLDNFNEVLADLFISLFNYEVKKENERPDIQSEQLYKILSNKIKQVGDADIEVLEYGTGKGRMLKNISKIATNESIQKIHWYLYEPFKSQRDFLTNKENLPSLEFIQIPEDLPSSKFDVIFLANVLHELSPNSIADILSYCANHLKKDGFIIIIELFPLLKPEKYSVSLANIEWSNLAMELGFKVNSGLIPIRNAMHEAYFIQLSLASLQSYQTEDIERNIKKYWNDQVLKNRIGEYDGGQVLTDIEEISKTLRLLTTITSISAYNIGKWNSSNELD